MSSVRFPHCNDPMTNCTSCVCMLGCGDTAEWPLLALVFKSALCDRRMMLPQCCSALPIDCIVGYPVTFRTCLTPSARSRLGRDSVSAGRGPSVGFPVPSCALRNWRLCIFSRFSPFFTLSLCRNYDDGRLSFFFQCNFYRFSVFRSSPPPDNVHV